jgi:4-aminobutyrate aminotransferase-like enzyme
VERKCLDLTAAFGVAASGHANPRIVRAGESQMRELLHAMGDVHPHRPKAELARELSKITFERWEAGAGKVLFSSSGFEAVESALKTAMLATGKSRVIAFEGGYHGLGYGALNVTHREYFRGPFRPQLREFGAFVKFPTTSEEVDEMQSAISKLLLEEEFSSILVEPVQVRGGINVPPPEFLPLLRQLCDHYNLLLIVDEIYTGFGRTGKWFACEHGNVVPDIICLGKAMTGGFPLSACVGKATIMDAWPPSTGEAIHTSTFLGHPVGCAMALAQIKELKSKKLPEASHAKGKFLIEELRELEDTHFTLKISARGLGLLAGVELQKTQGIPATKQTLTAIKKLLQRGYIFLPEGEHSNVISFTPPLTISRKQLKSSVAALAKELATL